MSFRRGRALACGCETSAPSKRKFEADEQTCDMLSEDSASEGCPEEHSDDESDADMEIVRNYSDMKFVFLQGIQITDGSHAGQSATIQRVDDEHFKEIYACGHERKCRNEDYTFHYWVPKPSKQPKAPDALDTLANALQSLVISETDRCDLKSAIDRLKHMTHKGRVDTVCNEIARSLSGHCPSNRTAEDWVSASKGLKQVATDEGIRELIKKLNEMVF